MATIYRFIVEARKATGVSYDADGNPVPAKGAGSKGGGSLTAHNPFGKNSGGVEHNRYMRPINPLMNQITGGWWEKGQRLGRAAASLPSAFKTKTGGFNAAGFGSTGALIIMQFAIMMAIQAFQDQQKKAKEENKSNFLKIKSGQTTIGQDYKVSKDIFGKITYGKQ